MISAADRVRVSTVLFTVALAIGIVTDVDAADMAEVTVENLVKDEQTDEGLDLRVVMVHLQTTEKSVFDIRASQKKSVGTLRKGHWAVVMIRKVNNTPRYVGGGVAAVIFDKTLVALFDSGIDAADNSN